MAPATDVIVVGAGTAGIPCAIAAAEAGARVTVVEKADRIGGTLHVSAGHMSAAGTRAQQRAGISDDTPELHFDDVMRISGGVADPALVRKAVELAPEVVDWLEDSGLEFSPETPAIYRGHEPYSRPRTHWGVHNGRSILEAMRPGWNEQVAAGAIKVLFEHDIDDLLVTARNVEGVLVRGPTVNGEVRAPVTVLATGGYGAAEDLFAELTPGDGRLVTNAMPDSTGKGLRLARQYGAHIQRGALHTPRLGLPELTRGRVDFWQVMANLTASERPPREVWVNRFGHRFVAEDATDVTVHEHQVMQQPSQEFWVVFDDPAIDMGQPLVRQWSGEQLRAAADRGEVVMRAMTVTELAQRAGFDAAGAQRTLALFRDAVATGHDPLGRALLERSIEEPPFYALHVPAAVLVTFGGLAVDDSLRVLGTSGPFDGLYAAGETLGMGATSGRAFCGGMAVTPALAFGRHLGRKLGAGVTG